MAPMAPKAKSRLVIVKQIVILVRCGQREKKRGSSIFFPDFLAASASLPAPNSYSHSSFAPKLRTHRAAAIMGHVPADDNALTARVLSLMIIIICSLCGVMYPLYLVSKHNDVRSTEW